MTNFTFIAPCHFGLESVLSGEIKRLGGQNVISKDGRITFDGDQKMLVKANLQLRCAERILIKLCEFKATSFEQLFQGVLAVNFEDYIGSKDAFPVKGYSLKSALFSVPDCQSIIKKAVVTRLKGHYNTTWFEETGPPRQIQFSILKNIVTIMLDTSGIGLHKRGYRKSANEAPIKETLAAGIIDLARIKKDSFLVDPFCGSGTFVIEGALKALNIASGGMRHFAAEKWDLIDKNLWSECRQAALANVIKDSSFKAIASDLSDLAITLTKDNATRAGVISKITTKIADIKDFSLPQSGAAIICNPPYGERMLEISQAEQLYTQMGKVFKLGSGNNYYIISAHEEFEKFFGTKATKRRKLYNGMIRCQLFMYY